MFSKVLYAELSKTNHHVLEVFTGAIATDIAAGSAVYTTAKLAENGGEPSFKPMSADQAAEIIINGMIKKRYQIVVGSDSIIKNILCRLNPKFVTNKISK